MSRLLYTPTDEQRLAVTQRIMAGATGEDLAAHLGIPVKRVKKVFRTELLKGPADAKHEVLSKLFEAARSGSNTTAAIFWTKARYGWRDTGAPERSDPEFWPPITIHSNNEPAQ